MKSTDVDGTKNNVTYLDVARKIPKELLQLFVLGALLIIVFWAFVLMAQHIKRTFDAADSAAYEKRESLRKTTEISSYGYQEISRLRTRAVEDLDLGASDHTHVSEATAPAQTVLDAIATASADHVITGGESDQILALEAPLILAEAKEEAMYGRPAAAMAE